eukprot:TRINITY_DN1568_c0_g1_i1.p1 TRINITY_DN1568_c0_g1~~TRINITY_DN1568_c0_g1_i1.p1  ORF type:complete len:404 (+),score=64.33 TRINITY_DN1568_c0_g1_i1:91-1302(+)
MARALLQVNVSWCVTVAVVLLVSSFAISYVECGEDYYKLLGVERTASDSQLSRAYKQLARKWHPDKYKDEATKQEAQEKFQKISSAYEALKDPQKRRIYDQHGEEGLKQQSGQQRGGHDPFSMFSNFFGGGHQQGQREPERGTDLTVELDVTLKDLFVGRELIVTTKKQILCPHCRGTGAKNPDDVHQCPVCKGSGVRIQTQRLGPGFVTQTQVTCDKCSGKGKIVKDKCPDCGGHKVSKAEETLTVVVERGMPDGEQIVFEQEGDQAPDRVPGNLIFKIRTAPHPRFERQGNDLHYKMEITLLEALTGFTKVIKHLDGHTVTIKRNLVTKPGYIMRVNGEGMPQHRYPSHRGTLFIAFTVRLPDTITEEQRAGFHNLLGSGSSTSTTAAAAPSSKTNSKEEL